MVSRLIDLPFSRGLDESTDDTVLSPPGMTELVNYRLTRAGRLEHRLGVVDQSVSATTASTLGDRPDLNKPQAIHGRFLAAGGHGYTCLATGTWACVGSLSRFVPTGSHQGLQRSSASFSDGSCASANGFLAVSGKREDSVILSVLRVFDEATGQPVFEQELITSGGTPDVQTRVVASGSVFILLRMDLLTGDIIANKLDMSVLPLTALSADVTIVVGAVAASGFDAAPVDSTSFLVSYHVVANAALRVLQTSNLATLLSGVASDGPGAKYTSCLSLPSPRCYLLSWLNITSRNVCFAAFDSVMGLVGVVTLGSAPGTAFSADNFHPVMGPRNGSTAVVGWTDSYLSGTYQTYRTTFRDATTAATAGSTYGPVYGYSLASKPFRSSTAFVETTAQPAVWLANHNPITAALDRSYFLMLLGSFSSTSNIQSCAFDVSAAPSAAVHATYALGATTQVPEVVESTASGQVSWQTPLQEAFRGLGTSTPQRKLQVYRFGDASRSNRSRARAVVPCQGSFAVLGGAPRYYDTGRLVELGMAHGPTPIAATPAATGSMTPGGTYRYIFVYEYLDSQGQRCLSYPSNPYTVTLGGGDAQVNFELLASAMWALPNAVSLAEARKVVIRPYRTGNNGTVFRYAPPTGEPNGAYAGPLKSFGRIQLQDVNSDAQISGNEAIYTQVGNTLSNYRAPPCRFGCEHEGRLITGGGWNANEFNASKLFFPGEGVQFTESAAFKIPCPEPGTGCASLDGTLVLFSERNIYSVNGDGPTDDGAGPFSPARRLPGRVGCVDWRSIVTTDQGILFRAADGFRMLPRGLGPTVFVGAAVKNKTRSFPETLGSATVTRAVSPSVSDHDSEQVACWLIGDAETPTAVKILTYSLMTNVWAEVSLPASGGNLQNVIGVWQDIINGTDVLGFARASLDSAVAGSLLVENPASGFDRDISGSFEPLLNGSWKTGKVFPFGFGGRGTIRALRIVGECLAPTTLTPTVYTDGNTTGYASTVLTFSAGRFAVEIPLRQKDIEWVQIGVADPTTGSANRGAGLRFNGLALEVEMDPGLIRSPAANRSI